MKIAGYLCLTVALIAGGLIVGLLLPRAEAVPVARTPAGHLMMVLTDGKDFYVADGAGIAVFDPNVVHRLIVAEPNTMEPNTP